MSTQERFQHFGVWIRKTNRNKLSRENYAIIDKKSTIWRPSTPLRFSDPEKRKKFFEDEECKIYCDTYCNEWREKCLVNFDKNMAFFNNITKESFEEALQRLIKSNKKIQQIFNLNDCKEVCGIYVLVLDEYKQIYIGQAKDIKRRIMEHWSKKKEFDKLIFGGVNASVLSIDSFGALDTTRIFILKTKLLDSSERFAANKIPAHLRLNRIGGGVPIDKFDALVALSKWNNRELK